jgi:hypothetical protein
MLTVAALGTDRGDAALRAAGQWALVLGRHPTFADLGGLEQGVPERPGDEPAPDGEGRVGRASLPCDPERIRALPVEIALAFFERLRRHESASDLLIVRIPVSERLALMRAAFLSGTVVVPFEESEADHHEAVRVSREILESFHEISVWPYASSPRGLERYLAAIGDRGGARIAPFGPENLDLAASIDGLREPPREGFLVGLLAPEPATLPSELLRMDSVVL